ncbi:MAG: winged helix-turn-helix domain-containing protein [Burkholderiales bacterium]
MRAVAVGARAFDLLLMLLERPGQLVAKEALLERVWRGLVVEENNLQVQISGLRKLLGAHAIETVSGSGYRFALPVETTEPISLGPRTGRSQLPRPLTSFVGREAEIAELTTIVEHSRLSTLTGIGGCGKTRLAIRFAEIVLPAFPDGACFVDLSPVTDGRYLSNSIAMGLGEQLAPRMVPEDSLATILEGRNLLLILDNCEHLLPECCRLVAALLAHCSDLRILATSREPLGIAGERHVALQPLSLPPAGLDQDPDALGASDSVRLFVDRARLVAPALELSGRTGGYVASICRRLDGIPLAIELAAARSKVLSVEQIHALLDQRFRLLVGASHVLPRHRLLEAVVAWSYDQLDEVEQGFARKLSVFAGGWTLAGASAVADSVQDPLAAASVLQRLADKSLISIDHDAGSEPRYAMLQTVQQFMDDRLVAAGEREGARTRHLLYYVERAEALGKQYLSLQDEDKTDPVRAAAGRRDCLGQFDAERENIVKAHQWCDFVDGGAELGLRIVNAIRVYWTGRRHVPGVPAQQGDLIAEGRKVVSEALARVGAQVRNADRCTALLAASRLSCFAYRFDHARTQLEESLAIARDLGNPDMIGLRVDQMAYVCRQLGDLRAASTYANEALAAAESSGRPGRIGRTLLLLGALRYDEGNPVEAQGCFERALAIARDLRYQRDASTCLLQLSMVFIDSGDVVRAGGALLEALAISEEIKADEWKRCVVMLSASLASRTGHWRAAARLRGAATRLAEVMDTWRDPDDDAFSDRHVGIARRELGEMEFLAAEAEGRMLNLASAVAEAGDWIKSVIGSRSDKDPG